MLTYQRPIPFNSCLAFMTDSDSFRPVWHTQSEFEIVYIEAGEGTIQYAESRKTYREGDILVLGPDIPHQYVAMTPQYKTLSVLFRNDVIMPGFFEGDLARGLRAFLREVGEGLFFPCKGNREERELIERILTGSTLSKAGNFLLLLDRLAGRQGAESFNVKRADRPEVYTKLQDIFQYIRDNAHRRLHIEEVARMAHMSRCHFSRFFNRHAGRNFNEYVMGVRIERACSLLLETSRSVSEIAFETGFESLSSFNRGFVKLKKTTPMAYRRQD